MTQRNVIFGQNPIFLIYLATENIQIYDFGNSLKDTKIKIINACFFTFMHNALDSN